MGAAPTRTAAELKQRRDNVKKIADKRRSKETCKRNHDNWSIRPDGTRRCNTCDADRSWYRRKGLKYL